LTRQLKPLFLGRQFSYVQEGLGAGFGLEKYFGPFHFQPFDLNREWVSGDFNKKNKTRNSR